MTSGPITVAFPVPPPLIRQAFDDAAAVTALLSRPVRNAEDQRQVDSQLALYGDIDLLPRPWIPSSCPTPVRAALWPWLDDVAAWINHQHVWDAERSIPECWPQHPPIANELPVLAARRLQAGDALSADLLDDWHRYALPAFLDRLQHHATCHTRHHNWPGQPRHDRYTSPESEWVRKRIFDNDTCHPQNRTAPLTVVT